MPTKKPSPKYEPGKIPEPFMKTEYHHVTHAWDRFKKTKQYRLSLQSDYLFTFLQWLKKEYRLDKK